MKINSNYSAYQTQNPETPSTSQAPANGQYSYTSKLQIMTYTKVGSIVQENSAAVAPKHIPLATSELIACRAVAILGSNSNYLAHIFEWPRDDEAHSLSMQKMLDNSARMLELSPYELTHCKVAIVCGAEACDDIHVPLRQALTERNILAEWFDGRHSNGEVYASLHQNEIGLGHNEVEEIKQTGVISEQI